jgi:hypothetical protein
MFASLIPGVCISLTMPRIDDSSDEVDDEGSDEDTQPEECVAEFLLNAPDHHVNVPSGMQKGINKVVMKVAKARAASRPAREEMAFRTKPTKELVWGERNAAVLKQNQLRVREAD